MSDLLLSLMKHYRAKPLARLQAIQPIVQCDGVVQKD